MFPLCISVSSFEEIIFHPVPALTVMYQISVTYIKVQYNILIGFHFWNWGLVEQIIYWPILSSYLCSAPFLRSKINTLLKDRAYPVLRLSSMFLQHPQFYLPSDSSSLVIFTFSFMFHTSLCWMYLLKFCLICHKAQVWYFVKQAYLPSYRLQGAA